MDDVTRQALLSATRTLLAAAGAWMATHKYIDAGAADQIVGAVMVIIPIAWGMWQKYSAEKKTAVREVAAVNAGAAAATMGEVGPTVRTVDVPQIIEKFSPPVVQQPKGATPA